MSQTLMFPKHKETLLIHDVAKTITIPTRAMPVVCSICQCGVDDDISINAKTIDGTIKLFCNAHI